MFRVVEIHAEQYACFSKLDLTLSPVSPVILVGANGTGKTRLLALIRAAANTFKQSNYGFAGDLRLGAKKGAVEIQFEVEGQRPTFRAELRSGGTGSQSIAPAD